MFPLSLLSICRPNAFQWDQVVGLTPVERLDHAFTVAKDQLAIERLLDPEGTEKKQLARSFWKRITTQSLFKKFNNCESADSQE